MSTVLITGVTAPLGRLLAERQLADGARVIGVGREPHSPFCHPRFDYQCLDLTRDRHIRRLLFDAARGAEVLVHAARHRSARKVGPRAHRLNVGATRTLLRLAEDHPTLRRFVYVSSGAVYRVGAALPDIVREDQPLNLDPAAPQWVRDRVEADITMCTQMGLSRLRITVLRMAEILAPHLGSQLWDYLHDHVCLRPMGYDPMINVLSVSDAVRALELAARCPVDGAINVPGYDTLPLSRAITRAGSADITLPGPLLGPAYALRRLVRGAEFRYDLNRGRFHVSGILDGARARTVLGYTPSVSARW